MKNETQRTLNEVPHQHPDSTWTLFVAPQVLRCDHWIFLQLLGFFLGKDIGPLLPSALLFRLADGPSSGVIPMPCRQGSQLATMVEGGRKIDEVAAGETSWMRLSKQLSEQLVDDRQVHRYGMTEGEKRHTSRVYTAGEVSLRFGGERVGGAGRISWSSLLQGDQTWMLVLLTVRGIVY